MCDNDQLFDAIDGACGVEIDRDTGIAVVWHGGATFNVYGLPGWVALDCFTRYGNDNGDPLDPQAAREAMREHLRGPVDMAQLSEGFDAGNYANAYSTPLLSAIEDQGEVGPAYRAGFVLGFFSSYERYEVPADALDEYDTAMSNFGDMAREAGVID